MNSKRPTKEKQEKNIYCANFSCLQNALRYPQGCKKYTDITECEYRKIAYDEEGMQDG